MLDEKTTTLFVGLLLVLGTRFGEAGNTTDIVEAITNSTEMAVAVGSHEQVEFSSTSTSSKHPAPVNATKVTKSDLETVSLTPSSVTAFTSDTLPLDSSFPSNESLSTPQDQSVSVSTTQDENSPSSSSISPETNSSTSSSTDFVSTMGFVGNATVTDTDTVKTNATENLNGTVALEESIQLFTDSPANTIVNVSFDAVTETTGLSTNYTAFSYAAEHLGSYVETSTLLKTSTAFEEPENTSQSMTTTLDWSPSSLENVTVQTAETILTEDSVSRNYTRMEKNDTIGTFSSTIVDTSNFSFENVSESNGESWNNSSVTLNVTTPFPIHPPTTDLAENDTASISMDLEPTEEDGSTATAQPWFLLQFAGNCSFAQEEFDVFKKEVGEQFLRPAGVPEQNASVNLFNCSKNFLLNISVSSEYETKLSQYFKKLDASNHSKVHINDDIYFVNLVEPNGNKAFRHPPEVILSSRHTDIEFVIYVALGSACTFLLLLAVLLVTCKYCRSKPYKGFDVSEVPHLNLRLEDYTLTRIPRAKSIYADYCRGSTREVERYCPLDEQEQATQSNGMVHPFDTSVVPLEDAPDKPTISANPPQVETFGRPNPSNDYEELESNAVNSTENLHQKKVIPPPPAPWGVDNVSFST